MGENISTSVDQLMKIVSRYDKISFKDAAKELNVPVKTIQEWVTILEEEHLIKVVYSFTTPYIIRQTLSESDNKAKIKRFSQKKDNLSVRLDMTAKFFEDLDAEMTEVSNIVTNVEKNMDSKLAHISEDLKELAEAELRKEKLDEEIIESKERSFERIQKLERHIQKSELNFEESFQKIKKDFKADVIILEKNQSFVEKMKLQEQRLHKKLIECDSLSKKIHSDFAKQTKTVKDAAEHMTNLQKERALLLKQVEVEHTQLKEILAKSKEFEKSIRDMQKKVYTKITDKIKTLEEKQKGATKLPKNIHTLLEKKTKLKNIISDLTHAQVSAKNEVERLRHESELLQKHIGMKDVDFELQKIHDDIDALKKHKSLLSTRLKDLYAVLNVKN